MRIAICDDIPQHAEALAGLAREYGKTNSLQYDVGVYGDPDALLAEKQTPDLILLDWKLQEATGLEAARVFRRMEPTPTIVFVSAYPEYVFDSFEVAPFWYLVKPVSYELFSKMMDAFLAYSDRDLAIGIPTQSGERTVSLREIMYIEASRKCSIVRVCANGSDKWETIESTKPLAELAAEIRSPRFFRTHRSFLINMDHIERIGGGIIYIKNGERVLLSRRNRSAFEKTFNAFLKKNF